MRRTLGWLVLGLAAACSGQRSDDLSHNLGTAHEAGADAAESDNGEDAAAPNQAEGAEASAAVPDSATPMMDAAPSANDAAIGDASRAQDGGSEAGPSTDASDASNSDASDASNSDASADATVSQVASSGLAAIVQLSVAYDAQLRPVLMSVEAYHPADQPGSSLARIAFRRLQGGTWSDAAAAVELGAYSAATTAQAPFECVGFALDDAGNPAYVALNSDQVSYHVQRWSGSSWSAIGSQDGLLPVQTSKFSGCISPPHLSFASSAGPLVVYDTKASITNAVTVWAAQYDGETWSALGPNGGAVNPAAGDALVSHALAFDSGGHPFVAYSRRAYSTPTDASAYVTHYVAAPAQAWAGVGSTDGVVPNAAGPIYTALWGLSLVLDKRDHPFLAAAADLQTGGSALIAFRFDGNTWSVSDQHGKPAPNAQDSAMNQLGTFLGPDGSPFAVWSETGSGASYGFFAATWTGSAWNGYAGGDGLLADGNPSNTLRTLARVRAAGNTQGGLALPVASYDLNANAYQLALRSYAP